MMTFTEIVAFLNLCVLVLGFIYYIENEWYSEKWWTGVFLEAISVLNLITIIFLK